MFTRLLLVSVVFFNCLNTFADERKPFKMAIPSFPPFYFEPHPDDFFANNKQGLVVLYVELLRKRVNFPIDIVHMPFARIPSSLIKGEIDGAIMFKNTSLNQVINYIGPISKSHVVLIPDKDSSITRYEDLYNLESIAVVRGIRLENKFDHDLRLNKYFVKDYKQGLDMLMRGRAHAIIGGLEALDYNLKSVGNTALSELGDPVFINDKEIGLHISTYSNYLNESRKLRDVINSLYQPYLFQSLYLSEISSTDQSVLDDFRYLQP